MLSETSADFCSQWRCFFSWLMKTTEATQPSKQDDVEEPTTLLAAAFHYFFSQHKLITNKFRTRFSSYMLRCPQIYVNISSGNQIVFLHPKNQYKFHANEAD